MVGCSQNPQNLGFQILASFDQAINIYQNLRLRMRSERSLEPIYNIMLKQNFTLLRQARVRLKQIEMFTLQEIQQKSICWPIQIIRSQESQLNQYIKTAEYALNKKKIGLTSEERNYQTELKDFKLLQNKVSLIFNQSKAKAVQQTYKQKIRTDAKEQLLMRGILSFSDVPQYAKMKNYLLNDILQIKKSKDQKHHVIISALKELRAIIADLMEKRQGEKWKNFRNQAKTEIKRLFEKIKSFESFEGVQEIIFEIQQLCN